MPAPFTRPTEAEMEAYRRTKDAMGHPTHRFGLPINGLDDFEAPLAAERWNGFPVPLVGHDVAVQIAEAVGDLAPAPYYGLKPYTGLCWQVLCPACGGEMTLEEGAIEEPRLTRFMKIVRKVRPAVFWACGACEHCEEVSRG